MTSVQAAFGGGVSYAVPDHDINYYAKSISGSQIVTAATTEIYNADGADDLGADLMDVETGYLAIWWFSCAVNSTGDTTSSVFQGALREGATASTVSGGGSAVANDQHRTVGDDIAWYHSQLATARPAAGRESEFGIHFVNQTAGAPPARMGAATLVLLPVKGPGLFSAGTPTIGTSGVDWVQNTDIGTVNYNNQVGGDATQTASTTFAIGRTGQYLVFLRSAPFAGASIADRALRWYHKIDGVDVANVYTGTATVGAVRTGRGFQVQYRSSVGYTNIRGYMAQARIMNLTAGNHTWAVDFNRHESADPVNSEQLQNNLLAAINTDRFRQFEYTEVSTVQTGDTVIFTQRTAFNTSITVEGDAKVLIMLSTSVMNADVSGIFFKITRNGVAISGFNSEAGYPALPIACGPYAALNGQTSVADSDNNVVPTVMWWVDDDPGAGTHVYGVQSGATTGSPWNCNDNGASGFIGSLAVMELALSTS